MSITVTKVGENKSTGAGTTLTPDSYVLQSGKEYILAAFADDPSGTPSIPTKTGATQLTSGTVFTQQGHQPRITLFRITGDGSTNINATNLVWATSQDSRMYMLLEITGSLTGSSLVALVSAGEYTDQASLDTTLGVGSFAMSSTTGNAVIAFGYNTVNGTISAKSGYTTLGTLATLTDNSLQALGEYKVAQDTAPDFTKPAISYGIGIAVEIAAAAAATAALSGTATGSITEGDIVAGGKTIVLTLTNDTWVTAGATFDAQRQNIINGIDSAQAESGGWDAKVKGVMGVSAVVRTSSTVVTITLPATATFNITAQETVTATIPGTALSGGNAIVATPTFTIDTVAAPPVITSIASACGAGDPTGPLAGGTHCVMTGTGFNASMTVTVGGVAVDNFQFNSSTEVEFDIPAAP